MLSDIRFSFRYTYCCGKLHRFLLLCLAQSDLSAMESAAAAEARSLQCKLDAVMDASKSSAVDSTDVV